LREAGGNLCGASKVANVLNNSDWWAKWRKSESKSSQDIHGYKGNDDSFPKAFGTGRAERVSGTDAVVVWSGTLNTLNEGLVITQHDPPSAQFKVNTPQHGLEDGDIVVACDNNDNAAIFQVTNVDSSNGTINASVSPGILHCSPPPDDPRPYCFISKLAAYAWYIGYNGRGGRSLYRLKLQNNNGTAEDTAEEVAEGVSNLKIEYLIPGNTDYVDASDASLVIDSNWTKVVAVRLEFTLQSLENGEGPCNGRGYCWNTVVTLRNRAPWKNP
jgi:type IV pilus assembly protein PilW